MTLIGFCSFSLHVFLLDGAVKALEKNIISGAIKDKWPLQNNKQRTESLAKFGKLCRSQQEEGPTH